MGIKLNDMKNENWWDYEEYKSGVGHEAPNGDWMVCEKPNAGAIAVEGERRGYEKAMKEVRDAVIPTAASLTLYNRQGQEETIDVYYVPKSFFYK